MSYQRIISTAPISQTPIQILERVPPVEISPGTDETSLLSRMEGTIAIVACGVEAKITLRYESPPSV